MVHRDEILLREGRSWYKLFYFYVTRGGLVVNRQQYVNLGVLDVLMHVPPYNYNFRYIVVAFATCSDTRYQWAPLHLMWGRVTIMLFF